MPVSLLMCDNRSRWQPVQSVADAALTNLLSAWKGWSEADNLPLRSRFDPMMFGSCLPWKMLSEILGQPNDVRPYDVIARYIGTEIEHYFAAASFTRVALSTFEAAYTERWFSVLDDAITQRQPHFYRGAPYRTGFEFVELEMLSLPLSLTGANTDFVILALARRDC